MSFLYEKKNIENLREANRLHKESNRLQQYAIKQNEEMHKTVFRIWLKEIRFDQEERYAGYYGGCKEAYESGVAECTFIVKTLVNDALGLKFERNDKTYDLKKDEKREVTISVPLFDSKIYSKSDGNWELQKSIKFSWYNFQTKYDGIVRFDYFITQSTDSVRYRLRLPYTEQIKSSGKGAGRKNLECEVII